MPEISKTAPVVPTMNAVSIPDGVAFAAIDSLHLLCQEGGLDETGDSRGVAQHERDQHQRGHWLRDLRRPLVNDQQAERVGRDANRDLRQSFDLRLTSLRFR